jgi:hypothetical protein
MKSQLIVVLAAFSFMVCDANAFARGPARSGRNSSGATSKSDRGQRAEQMRDKRKGSEPTSDMRREEPAPLK